MDISDRTDGTRPLERIIKTEQCAGPMALDSRVFSSALFGYVVHTDVANHIAERDAKYDVVERIIDNIGS